MNTIKTDQDITELFHAAKALAAVSACTELGVFDALAGGAKAQDELPLQERAGQTVMPVLLHLGLVLSDGHRYALSSAGRELHRSGELPTARNFDFLRDLVSMPAVLREGGPVRDEAGKSKATTGGVLPEDVDASRAFLDMLYRGSERAAVDLLEWTRNLIADGARVLDLGGGHGRYARTFADAGYRATLFDLPLVVEIAKERHGDRLDYMEGDFQDPTVDLGGPYDMVVLSNIIHGQSPAENADLVARLARVLAPGGVLVVKDMFVDDRNRDPAQAVFFGLTMLFYTDRGRSYSISEAERWYRAADLEPAGVTSLETHDLCIARRPSH